MGESNKMSKEIHSQDSAFEKVWKEMEEIEPLTPSIKQCYDAFVEAAEAYDKVLDELDGPGKDTI